MVKTSEGKIYDMASINARNIPQKEVVPLITLDDVKLDLESGAGKVNILCLLYTSPSPRDRTRSRMPSSA